jgi:signal transduction histidine kinase
MSGGRTGRGASDPEAGGTERSPWVPSAAPVADYTEVSRTYAEIVGLLDQEAILRRCAELLVESAGFEIGGFGRARGTEGVVLTNPIGGRAMVWQGVLIPRGLGLSGKALATGRPESVSDYFKANAITHEFDWCIRSEQIACLLAVPVVGAHRTHAVLYAGARRKRTFTGQAIDRTVQIARDAALGADVAERAANATQVAMLEDRSRVARDLHDTVGAMLFAIGAGVRNLQDRFPDSPDLRERLAKIERQAAEASAALRETIRTLHASPAELALGVALQKDCKSFEERTGIPTHLMILSEVPALDGVRVRVLLEAVREALLNVEKHAHAQAVVVSLCSDETGLSVAVTDDGIGLPGDLPDDGPRFGLRQSADALERLGGRLKLSSASDGSTTWQAWIPS